MQNLWQTNACDIATSVNKKERTAVEITQSALNRLHQVNGQLNAVVQHDDAWSMDQARVVDHRIAQGEQLPLAGVPITVKDNI